MYIYVIYLFIKDTQVTTRTVSIQILVLKYHSSLSATGNFHLWLWWSKWYWTSLSSLKIYEISFRCWSTGSWETELRVHWLATFFLKALYRLGCKAGGYIESKHHSLNDIQRWESMGGWNLQDKELERRESLRESAPKICTEFP